MVIQWAEVGRGPGNRSEEFHEPAMDVCTSLFTFYCPLLSHRAPATCKEGRKYMSPRGSVVSTLSPSTAPLSSQQTPIHFAYMKYTQPHSQEIGPKSSLLSLATAFSPESRAYGSVFVFPIIEFRCAKLQRTREHACPHGTGPRDRRNQTPLHPSVRGET